MKIQALILIISGFNLEIKNTNFKDIQGNIGGCMALIKGHVNSQYNIKNTTFFNSKSEYGAALYIYNQNVKIFNSTFCQNLATDSGGSIYFFCDSTLNCNWSIFGSKFIKNIANKEELFILPTLFQIMTQKHYS